MTEWRNQLWYGDNLNVLREHIPTESVDLIYLDPPFNSNRSYNVLFKNKTGDDAQAQIEAFDDTWTWSQEAEDQYKELVTGGHVSNEVVEAIGALRGLLGTNDMLAYLVMMTARLAELRRVLKPGGITWVHCDPTASHYLKLVMDALFGIRGFVNEVIWQRTATKGDATRKFGAVHDTLLMYAKSPKYDFAPAYVEPDAAYIARFSLNDDDGRGPYRLAPLDSPNPRPNLTYEYKGYPPPTKGWRVSPGLMAELDADGRLAFPANPDGRIARKHYLNEQKGKKVTDVWTDIKPLQATSAERLGYPTQKPEELLHRVIETCSRPGATVLDPFCGCGTTIDAAEKLGRRWIGIDVTYLSVDLMQKRLQATYGGDLSPYVVKGIPEGPPGAKALFESNPFEFERWAVSCVDGQPNEKQVGDKGVDGVIRFPTDNERGTGRCIVSVKGGQQINPAMVRDLIGTVDSQNAEMGVLVLMKAPTRGMKEAANKSGSYVWPVSGQSYPRVQIITVADIFKSKKVDMPTPFLPYVQAKRYGGHQLSVFES